MQSRPGKRSLLIEMRCPVPSVNLFCRPAHDGDPPPRPGIAMHAIDKSGGRWIRAVDVDSPGSPEEGCHGVFSMQLLVGNVLTNVLITRQDHSCAQLLLAVPSHASLEGECRKLALRARSLIVNVLGAVDVDELLCCIPQLINCLRHAPLSTDAPLVNMILKLAYTDNFRDMRLRNEIFWALTVAGERNLDVAIDAPPDLHPYSWQASYFYRGARLSHDAFCRSLRMTLISKITSNCGGEMAEKLIRMADFGDILRRLESSGQYRHRRQRGNCRGTHSRCLAGGCERYGR